MGFTHAGAQEAPLAGECANHFHVVGVWEEVPRLRRFERITGFGEGAQVACAGGRVTGN